MMFVPHRKQTYGPHGLLGEYLYFLYVDVRTSQEAHLMTATISYGDSFTFYVDDVLQKLTLNFVDKWRSLSRYSSLAD
jgi:hypothetical protein